MASRVRGNVQARFRGGEKAEITSKPYLFLSQTMALKYCYMASLAIATGDDPEADSKTDEAMTYNQNPSVSSTSTPSPKNSAQKTRTATKLVCHDCGSPISQKVADYSQSKFGKFLCYNCQRSQQNAA